ncbi:cysteine desulfurase [Bacillus sp. H-16]|uniref:cysteine desulfurase family protein n=1 Tax=Alteribacter salitolerans TaxID=2912333 RepID=UPI0019636EED|nr:cysteine desulfurase family protein [Alteribacter salitolerans]MBM7096425.1 cysteine desulfurase [Alteribacter salitolerans]
MIYFDNSATTRPYPEVVETFAKVSVDFFGNPSSLHPGGKQAERLLVQTRERAASLLNVDFKEVLFTSGGTESNNLAIKGTAYQHRSRGRHLITSEAEHPSSYETFRQLEQEGFNVTYLPVNNKGIVSLDDVKQAVGHETVLVSLLHVNNELGSINPVEQIGNFLLNHPKVLFHVDHVQGVGKVPLHLKNAKVDFCSFSSHKFHGLKGTGLLYARAGTKLSPIFKGGSQEHQMRAGTENVAGATAMVKALRMTQDAAVKRTKELYRMSERLIEELKSIDGVYVNTPEERAPHIVNFSVPGLKPEVLVQSYGEKSMYVSTKSACSSKFAEPSRVLTACGFNYERAASGVRVSLSFENTNEEMSAFIDYTKEMIPSLLKVVNR